MKRPDVPAMAEIERKLQKIQDLQDSIAQINKELKAFPSLMAEQLDNEQERIEAAQYLYWMVQEIPVVHVSEGLLGLDVYKFRSVINSVTAGIECAVCGEAIPISSRTALLNLRRDARDHLVLCSDCRKDDSKRMDQEREARDAANEKRLSRLRTMPYKDYLRTEEWQQRRQMHLRSTGHRCQVCNAHDVQLDVHHRTYARRGQETFKDLIVLCRDCHGLFHSQGKLSQ